MPKYKGKERRAVSRYRVTEKANFIIGSGSAMHTIPVELRSIGLGGALVRILGAFARNVKLAKGNTFIFAIEGSGPLTGITAPVKVVADNPGAYGSRCVNLAFHGRGGKDADLEGENKNIFMRWRRPQTAVGRMMQALQLPRY